MNELPPQSRVIESGSWKKQTGSGGAERAILGCSAGNGTNAFPFTRLACDFLDTEEGFYFSFDPGENTVSCKLGNDREKVFRLGIYWGPEFLSALHGCHFELPEPENDSNPDESREWTITLYQGNEAFKAITGSSFSRPPSWDKIKTAWSILEDALDLKQ